MGFINRFSIDKDGNPVISTTETAGEGATFFDLPKMTEEESREYWAKVKEQMAAKAEEESREYWAEFWAECRAASDAEI